MRICTDYPRSSPAGIDYPKEQQLGSPGHRTNKGITQEFRIVPTDIAVSIPCKPPAPPLDMREPRVSQNGLAIRKVLTPTEKPNSFKCIFYPSTNEPPKGKYFRSMKSHPNADTPESVKSINSQEPNNDYYAQSSASVLFSASKEFRGSHVNLSHQTSKLVQGLEKAPRYSDNRAQAHQKLIYNELMSSPDVIFGQMKPRADEGMFKKYSTNLKETTSTLSTLKLVHQRSNETLPRSEPRWLATHRVPAPKESKLSIDDFQKLKFLGKGKFGAVFMVRHKKTGFLAALKVIKKKQIAEEKLVTQLVRQLKLHAFMRHQNIIDFYGFFEDRDNMYILLELASDGHLYTKLKRKETYSEQATAFIIYAVLDAVSYLHNNKLLHRDIKPQNIVMVHGTVKLCDFGWAVFRGNDLRSTFCGTPLYVSPEILLGQPYGEHTDIWAIGILTYELVMGQIPFSIKREEELQKIVTDEIRFPSDMDLSDEYKDFVLRILKKNPSQRLSCENLMRHPFLEKYRGLETCEELCRSN